MKRGNTVQFARAKIDELLEAKRGVSRVHKIQLQRRRALLAGLPTARQERMAQITLEWIDLVVSPKDATAESHPHRTATGKAHGRATISANDADRRAKGPWFRGHTSHVVVENEGFRVPNFDVAKREKKAGSAEYVLFEGDVTVEGTLSLGGDSRSIYVVLGDLTARRIELGDAALVVRGTMRATDYVFAPRNEGIFAVGGEQKPERQLAHVKTPTYFAYDPHAGGHRLFVRRGSKLVNVPVGKCDASVCCGRDDGVVLDANRVLRRLRSGKTLVKD